MSLRKFVRAAGDVARFYSGPRRYRFEHQELIQSSCLEKSIGISIEGKLSAGHYKKTKLHRESSSRKSNLPREKWGEK